MTTKRNELVVEREEKERQRVGPRTSNSRVAERERRKRTRGREDKETIKRNVVVDTFFLLDTYQDDREVYICRLSPFFFFSIDFAFV